jgi:endonuclease/exonuclease/phosphatase family metal-dependent hydrolase
MVRLLPPSRSAPRFPFRCSSRAPFLVAALVGLLASLGTSSAPAADKLTLVTLNCEFMYFDKVHLKFGYPFELKDADLAKWKQTGFREQRYREALDAVARLIRRIDADVLVLHEVGKPNDVAELHQAVKGKGLEYPFVAVCRSTDTSTGQHTAVLSKRQLKDVQTEIAGREGYMEEEDDPETEATTGVSKGLTCVFEANGRPVHLFACHLRSERGGHAEDMQRVAQASIVRRHCIPLLNAGKHVIVAGDLNDHPGQPAVRRIRGQDDIWEDLVQTGNTEYFPEAEWGERWTIEFRGMRQQIDHVLPSNSLREACGPSRIRAKTIAVSETIAGTEHRATDHRAFAVTFEFPD